ncbi:hypothetical protein PD_1713 [Xylella fastidiosa Temecula1]|uniref:Uncharacterized protein n=2 Tax=Xylella fastidiosa TaxID=2371 RepID=Q87AV0_XYLFT|nr:hypothetical protein PD_1713 [Xylella fastidiosa Temecula1]
MGASSCVDVALGFSDFPNIHRIGLTANPRLKSNSSNKSFRAFTCDRGGRLQKSGKAGLDDRPPQMDKRVRKEAPHSEVKKVPFSRRIGHLLPVGCGGSAEDVCTRFRFRLVYGGCATQVFPIHVGAEFFTGHSSHCRPLNRRTTFWWDGLFSRNPVGYGRRSLQKASVPIGMRARVLGLSTWLGSLHHLAIG